MHNISAGRGAYSEGSIILDKTTKFDIYVGTRGHCSNVKSETIFYQGGLNAIGPKYNFSSCTRGGATFISSYNNKNDIFLISGSGGGSAIFEKKKNIMVVMAGE